MILNDEQKNYLQQNLGVTGARTLAELPPMQRLEVANLGESNKQRRGLELAEAPTESFAEPKIDSADIINGWTLDSESLEGLRPEIRLDIAEIFKRFKAANIEQRMINEASMRSYSQSDVNHFMDRLKPFMKQVDNN